MWHVITDWERQSEWMLEMSDVVVTSGHRSGLGVEAEATIRVAGIQTRDRIRVAAWDPERRLGIEHLGWVTGRGELFLSPLSPSATFLVWVEELEPPLGWAGLAGIAAFRPLLKRTFERDLEVLEEIVRKETRPPD